MTTIEGTKQSTREIKMLTGNEAVAEAVILSRPDVIAAYPITPSSPIVQRLNSAVELGELDTEFIAVESEHSAMGGTMGASVAGGRAFTATASQGLLYMAENVVWAGYGRFPMVAAIVNRALAPGWTIWVDHQDSMMLRDAGWGQLYVKNNQEAFDTIIQAFKIAEHHDVYIPFMVCLDGFVLSHTASKVEMLTQQEVDSFLPPFDPITKLDPENPVSFGSLTPPEQYMALRKHLHNSFMRAKDIIKQVNKEFAEMFGRDYGGLIETYGASEPKVGIITMATIAEESEVAADMLTQEGIPTQVIRIRSFRPFPAEELAKVTKDLEHAIVIDRAVSFGNNGQLYIETAQTFFEHKIQADLTGLIMGLGGKDVRYEDVVRRVKKVLKGEDKGGFE